MNPLLIAALGIGGLMLLKKGPPSAALIPDIKGITPQKTTVPPNADLPNGATQYTYRFSKGTATIYGYWIVVDAKDSNTWISYAGTGDNQVRELAMSHGDPSITIGMAKYFNVATGSTSVANNPGF